MEPSQCPHILHEDEADGILQSSNHIEASREKYDPLKMKFEGHSIIKRHVNFEKAKFSMRVREKENLLTML